MHFLIPFLGCKYMGFNRKRIHIGTAFRIINSILRDLNFLSGSFYNIEENFKN